MNLAPYKILIFPYRITKKNELEFAICKRKSENHWQALAGQGVDDESPSDTVKRVGFELFGIDKSNEYFQLDSVAMIPAEYAIDFDRKNIPNVIPETCHSIKINLNGLIKKDDLEDFRWLSYSDALELVKWDSNKTALWEIRLRYLRGDQGL